MVQQEKQRNFRMQVAVRNRMYDGINVWVKWRWDEGQSP
jgi:hypothetical protein